MVAWCGVFSLFLFLGSAAPGFQGAASACRSCFEGGAGLRGGTPTLAKVSGVSTYKSVQCGQGCVLLERYRGRSTESLPELCCIELCCPSAPFLYGAKSRWDKERTEAECQKRRHTDSYCYAVVGGRSTSEPGKDRAKPYNAMSCSSVWRKEGCVSVIVTRRQLETGDWSSCLSTAGYFPQNRAAVAGQTVLCVPWYVCTSLPV